MGRQTKSFRQTPGARKADKAAQSFGTYQRMEPYGKRVKEQYYGSSKNTNAKKA